VELLSHVIAVQVVKHGLSESARRNNTTRVVSSSSFELGKWVLNPRSVVSGSGSLWISLQLAVDGHKTNFIWLSHIVVLSLLVFGSIANTKDVVDVDVVSGVSELVTQIFASLLLHGHRLVVAHTVVLVESVPQVLADQRVPVSNINKGGFCVVVPVGHSVSNKHAL